MTLLEKLRLLQAPADGGAGASGTGGTSTTDAGAGQGKDAGAAGAAAGGKDGAAGDAGAKRSILKGTGATGDASGGADAGKATDGSGAGSKDQSGAAEPYEVKVPEGVKVDEAELKAWTTTAKELGISAEAAGKLIGWNDQRVKAASEAQVQAWAQKGEAWYGELEKDQAPDSYLDAKGNEVKVGGFGGQNLEASAVALQKALTRFDPKGELVAELEKYGIENLPALAKYFRKVGLALGEDKVPPPPRPTVKAQTTEEARRAKRYPSIKGIQSQS